jgi:GWxTD domain-containing protein
MLSPRHVRPDPSFLWLLAALGAAARGADTPTSIRDASRSSPGCLLLPEEQALLKELRDDEDRRAFQEIFWARRDPTPGTAANELEASIRAHLDARRPALLLPEPEGSETGCGQVLALLGPPEEVQGLETRTRFDNLQYLREGDRRAETWVYRDRPSRAFRFTNAELRVAFDPECRFAEGGTLADDLGRAASGARSRARRSRTRAAPTAASSRLAQQAGSAGGRHRPAERAALRFPLAAEVKLVLRARRAKRSSRGSRRWPSAPASERASLAVRAADASGQPLGTAVRESGLARLRMARPSRPGACP